MLNSTTIINNLNYKPENPFVVRQEGVIVDAIHSRAFLFGEFDMSKFTRKDSPPPLCACGCGEKTKKSQNYKGYNKFINGHYSRGVNNPSYGKKYPEQSKRMIKNNPMHNPKIVAKISGENSSSKRPEVQRKISESLKALGDNHPSKRPEHRKMVSEQMKRNNPMHNPAIAKKVSKAKKGKPLPHMRHNNPMYNPIIAMSHSKRMMGNQHGKGYRFDEKDLIKRSGPNHWNWKGGISCNLYCDIWEDNEYKESIRERDNYTCQNPDCKGNCNYLTLCIHHINGNKFNCHPWNLISLCRGCNVIAEGNKKLSREWWQNLYQNIMTEKYGYEYNNNRRKK